MTPDERAAYRAQIEAEQAAAERERAAGYFGTARGIADLPRRTWRRRTLVYAAITLAGVAWVALVVGAYFAGWPR